ncbi:tubulin polyglutamylase ttll5 [Plakobranchus ocellatus]|uniref:Tubulin--tyrosine ligase-like protein 5 n=1 Tax=Plakobranchus ocellatus TaxID=259542 RepID=A0AAV4DBP9_9GAST|nr:tubulin polyglutamylase ttll5 [Plakobranchus ocellatus]
MASVRESRGADSDGNGSMTPSEQSENDEKSEHDSDYESDDGNDKIEPKGKALNVQWTGYGKRVPIVLFNAETILNKRTDFKAVGERYHLAFKFASTDCKIVRNILLSHGFHEVHPNSADYNLVWSNSHLKPFTLRTMTEFQKINHFPRSYELTRKDRLFKNLQRMQQIKGHKHFDFIPASYVLPGDYQDFCSNFLKDKGPYIVKPVASSRGRGVFLINHPDQVPLDENVIVSKYVASPLVIDGFKFDVRIYVTVTSYDPIVIYLYEEGLTRFATVKYERNAKHIRNQCMHLTNYSVNKRSQDYVKNDDPDVEDYGNKWSMGAMLRYLRSEGKDTAALMMRIEDVVIKTILSVESSVATACKMFQPFRGNCFELYGFDILLDENLKPWVLEVNLSPSLACDSPLDLKIKSNMLCDLFSLAGVVCHDPMMRTRQQQSKQASDLAAKMKPRLKSAPVRPSSAKMSNRPQSATSSTSKERNSQNGLAGLSSEEIKIVRRVKEEEARKGGWIRIFPTADSWDTYGSFLQFPTTHNLMLHQRFYPERHKAMTAAKTPGTSIITPSRSKNSIQLHVTGSGKADQEKFIESYAQALLRAKQYERRLGHPKSRSRRKKAHQHHKGKRNKLVQGVADEDNGENGSDEEGGHERGKDKKEKDAKSEAKVKEEPVSAANTTNAVSAVATANAGAKAASKELPLSTEKPVVEEKVGDEGQIVAVSNAEVTKDKSAAGEPNRISPPSSPPPPPPKFDVIGLLEKGHSLSKVQARTAFAMYLIRVQQRLLSDCGGSLRQEDIDALNEQMDLVLRFLKRAAINLTQAFRVVVPSKKLPLGDRRRILAKQLGDFVHIYNKETDHLKAVKVRVKMENKKARRSDSSEGLDETKFDQFVYTAAEGELEEVLTTYTKINKSAAIFLGGEPKPGANTLSEAKREMLSRRRENPDIAGGTVPVGGAMAGEDGTRARLASSGSINNNNIIFNSHSSSALDLRNNGLEAGGVACRPGSASQHQQPTLHHSPAHTYSQAVSIYTQRLGRPRSASSSGGNSRATGRTAATRPASAATNRPAQTSLFTTSDPIVDTYNEKAIQDALQRLALRQQARQYSSINSSNVLRHDVNGPSMIPSTVSNFNSKPPLAMMMRPASSGGRREAYSPAMSISGQSIGGPHSHANLPGQIQSRPGSQGHRFISMEEHLTRSGGPAGATGTSVVGRGGGIQQHHSHQLTPQHSSSSMTNGGPGVIASHAQQPLQSANATFNSFIEDPSTSQWQNEIASAYNEVTGVAPLNYHQASVNSRQFQIAQQQAMKQRMMEQSKAMLEQSRAKHDALVTQAQGQKQPSSTTTSPAYSYVDDLGKGTMSSASVGSFEHPSHSTHKPLVPRPPDQPLYKRTTSAHRHNRKPVDENNLNFNFYTNLPSGPNL